MKSKETNLKPEYERELKKIDDGKFKRFSSVAKLRKELDNA